MSILLTLGITLMFNPVHPVCDGVLARSQVVACARAHSAKLRVAAADIATYDGEVQAARTLLVRNPNAALTVGYRTNSAGDSAINVAGTLSQELEIAGQRRKRIAVASTRRQMSAHERDAIEREVIADALVAYYELLAANRRLAITSNHRATANRVVQVAEARQSSGLSAPIETDLARFRRAETDEAHALAQGDVHVATVRLAAALSMDPTQHRLEAKGELEPLHVPRQRVLELVDTAIRQRPDVARLHSEGRMHAGQIDVLARQRIPNPSLSLFAQSDGLDERVIGGGIAFPIPLPAPLGQTNRGEIAAERARLRRSEERSSLAQLDVSTEVATALHELTARRQAVLAYPPQEIERAQRDLLALADDITAGRLPMHDALQMQKSLLEFLHRHLDAQLALCLASVRLLWVSGSSFEEVRS